ncbi:MAG: TadE/TadG family type IV pilus assembly protein, partial [Beijerinckiaceae bacterium]
MPERARPLPAGLRRLTHFAHDRSGATMMLFGVVLPGLLVAGGAAIDLGMMVSKKATFQNVADSAALAAAKEFRLGNASLETTKKIAERYAQGALESAGAKGAIDVKADLQNRTVTVMINDKLPMLVMHMFGSKLAQVAAKATAKVVGGSPVCVVGLETNANGTVEMEKSARLEAPDCAVYSNSTKTNGLVAKDSATMRASFICSAGGKSSPVPGSFSPTPQTDCPVFADPLASRPPPAVSACVMTNAVIKTSTSLFPGTYCGGL